MENTKIEWTHYTWSPWFGCRRISPGCLHCYIEWTTPFRVRGLKHGDPRQRGTEAYWQNPLKWNRAAANGVCAICGRPAPMLVDRPCECGVAGMFERPRVFPSLCDWLDDEVPIEWLADFLKLIHDTPHLDWLVLTKRPELFRHRLARASHQVKHQMENHTLYHWIEDWLDGRAPHNVWLGTSVEDQCRADQRIPELLKIPAALRFLSVEPLLEFVDLSSDLCPLSSIHWVIVGGESGRDARGCNIEWIRSIVRHCAAEGVPCFNKQLGSNPFSTAGAFARNTLTHPKGGDPAEWPQDLRVRQFPAPKIL